MTPNGSTPEEVWPTMFVSRAEWEKSEIQRQAREVARQQLECDRLEVLHEIKADVKILLAWKIQTEAQEKSRSKALKEFERVQKFVDGLKTTAAWSGSLLLALLAALGTLAKFFIFDPIWQHIQKGGH